MSENTFEPQYSDYFETIKKYGKSELGLSTNSTWNTDPSRLTFVFSRYKFVSRMLSGYNNVLEIGCGDGFASKIVADRVKKLLISDADAIFVEEAKKINQNTENISTTQINYVENFIQSNFDGIYALDVFEHISPENEEKFLNNIVASLDNKGALILGIPSLESQQYASSLSKLGHVNCKTGSEFKNLLLSYFSNVFIFSMNDEVLHTGFHSMSQYLFALATNPINKWE